MPHSRVKPLLVATALALLHLGRGRSVEGIDTSIAGPVEEDVCAALQVTGQATMAVRDASEARGSLEVAKHTQKARAEDAEKAETKAKGVEKADGNYKVEDAHLAAKLDEGPDVGMLSEMDAGGRAAVISTTQLERRINMIWPGSGGAGTMDGGIWQAAKYGWDTGYTIDSILGSSGGASAAFFCLVDEALGTDQSLTTYKRVYNSYKDANVSGWSSVQGCNTTTPDDDSCWWYDQYKQALQDSRAFENVRNKLKISMYCKRSGSVVLYNFTSIDQVATALAAAGNGLVSYVWVSGLDDWCDDWDVATQENSGFPSRFNPHHLPVYYYSNGPRLRSSLWVSFCSGTLLPVFIWGYSCVDDAINLGKQQFNNSWYYDLAASFSISNDFEYTSGTVTWVER